MGNDQALIINFKYCKEDLTELYFLEDKIEEVLETASIGEFDGHEIDNDCNITFFIYGPSAERMYNIIKPILYNVKYIDNVRIDLRLESL